MSRVKEIEERWADVSAFVTMGVRDACRDIFYLLSLVKRRKEAIKKHKNDVAWAKRQKHFKENYRDIQDEELYKALEEE